MASEAWFRRRFTTSIVSLRSSSCRAVLFCGYCVQAKQKSCHTSTPFSSHQFQNISGSYSPPPHTRIKLQFASRTNSSVGMMRSLSRQWSASTGTQLVPRMKHGLPFTTNFISPGFFVAMS